MNDKPLFMISIVSEILGLHPQTIRQYERMGFIQPSRTVGNTRLYSGEDVEQLKYIIYLTKEKGVNLAGVEMIIKMKNQIHHLQSTLDNLSMNIKSKYNIDINDNANVTAIGTLSFIKVKIEKGQ